MEYPYGWPGGSPAFRPPLIVDPPWQAYGVRGAGLALAPSGCAVSGPRLDVRQGRTRTASAYASEDVTGSIGAPAAHRRRPRPQASVETDLVFARMAIVDVLKRGSKEISSPWENPSERRARHGHADRQRLRQGRRHLPRLPGELPAAGGSGDLDAGRSLPRQARQLGGQEPAALVAVLTAACQARCSPSAFGTTYRLN